MPITTKDVFHSVKRARASPRSPTRCRPEERVHLLLLEEADKGLDDMANGKVKDARQVIRRLTARRHTA
jgi:hypothetical protein